MINHLFRRMIAVALLVIFSFIFPFIFDIFSEKFKGSLNIFVLYLIGVTVFWFLWVKIFTVRDDFFVSGIMKFVYVFFIVVTCIKIIYVFPVAGWDFVLYCGGVECFLNGKNPYDRYELLNFAHNGLLFTYPAASFLFFIPLCWLGGIVPKLFFYPFWISLIGAIFYITTRIEKDSQELMLLAVLLIAGFQGVFWNFFTGNVGLFELLCFSCMFYFLLKKKYLWAVFFLFCSSAIKQLPFVCLFLFMFIPEKNTKKITCIVWGLSLMMLYHLISIVCFTRVGYFFYAMTTDNFDGASYMWYGSPSVLLLVSRFALKFGHAYAAMLQWMMYGAYVLCAGLIFIRFGLNRYSEFIERFSLGIITCLLILPRFKEYSYVLLLLPAYFLLKRMSHRDACAGVMIASGLPLLMEFVKNLIWPTSFFYYNQLIAAWIFYLYVLFHKEIKEFVT